MKGNIDEQYLVANRQSLGAKLRELREQQGLSQQELADKMSISRSTVSKIEDGKWNYGIDTLTLFSIHLNCKIKLQNERTKALD